MAKKKSTKSKVEEMENTPELFLVGLMIGGAAAYIMSDQNVRGRVLRYVVHAYGNFAQSVGEVKEQLADIQAELAAEQAVQA